MKFLKVQEILFQSHHTFTHACRKKLRKLNWLQKIPIKLWLWYKMFVFFPQNLKRWGLSSGNLTTCVHVVLCGFFFFFIKPTKCYRWLNPWSMVCSTKTGYVKFQDVIKINKILYPKIALSYIIKLLSLFWEELGHREYNNANISLENLIN